MGIEVGLSQVALQNVATQDFTSAELSAAPVATLALVSDAETNGTKGGEARQSFGATDGTIDRQVVHRIANGLTSTTARRLATAHTGAGRTAGVSQDFISHNSFLSNGWRADRAEQDVSFNRLALAAMFGGSDVTVETGTLTLGSGSGTYTKSLTNTTLTPNVIIFFTHCDDIASGVGSFHVPSYGIAHDTGTGIVQRFMSWHEEHSASTAHPRAYIGTSDCAAQHTAGSASFDWMLSCTGMSEGQFTASLDSSAGGDEVYFLALQLDNANVSLVDIDTPTTTGVHEETGAGFQPKFVFQVLSMMTALDTHDATANAGALAFSLFNANEHYCYAYHNEDGASTTNAQAMCDNKAVHFNADDGTTAYEGAFSQFTANGWELNYSTVDATVRKGFALAIGEASTGTPVNVDINAGTLTFFGQSQTASHGQSVDLAAGTLSFAGQGHTVAAGHSDAIGAGALSFTGQSQDVAAGASVDAGAGTLSFSGQALTVTQGVSAAIGAGTLNLTGKSLSVTTGATAAVSVDIQPGTLNLAGQSHTVTHGHSLDAGAGTLTLSGLAAQIAAGASVDVQAGTLTITGQSLDTQAGVAIDVQAGQISLSGQGFTDTRGQSLNIGAGTLTLAGQSLSVVVAEIQTPDGRTLSIPLDARTLKIGADSRDMTIPADVRSIKIH